MATWLAALIAVAAITTTYFFCVRPMLRGRGRGRGRGHRATTENSAQDTELDRQVAELREELRALRAQDALDSGRVPSSKPTPPAGG
jgi:transposase-like protein